MTAGFMSCAAQIVVDSFTVGPYIVEYSGKGDVKYRLRDNIDLYDFYELQRDTTIIAASVPETPVDNAIQLSLQGGASHYCSKEFGIEGLWKKNIAKNLYFNAGLSLGYEWVDYGHDRFEEAGLFEFGVPLQIELGNLNRQRGTLYGLFGLTPMFYSTTKAAVWNDGVKTDMPKKTGFLIMPSLEFGGNIPVGPVVMRIGVFGAFRINCTTSEIDMYKNYTGRLLAGAKIGIVL